MLVEKQKEVDCMKQQCNEARDVKDKLNKIYSTNRDLVTRKCALESAVANRDKQMQELNEKLAKKEDELSTINEKNQNAIYNQLAKQHIEERRQDERQ